MLRLRIFTAVALLAVLLPAVFYPHPAAFAVVAGVLMACGAWEWFRLNQSSDSGALAAGVACAAVCFLFWSFPLPAKAMSVVWSLSALAWVVGGGILLKAGVSAWSLIPSALRQMLGFVLLCFAWLAVVNARGLGINFLFSAMALVWVADIAAYFAGRRFGERFFSDKLAPSISPGKTREGAIGGLIGAVLLAFGWYMADQHFLMDSKSIFSILAERHWLFMLLGAIFLGLMSICGDLLESLVKRSAGAKDSSQLLPGHGGVLDRVDALLPVIPLAMLLQAF